MEHQKREKFKDGEMNLKSYGVLHPPKLPLNAYANVVQDEFPEKELARIGKGSMVHKEAPILVVS